MLKWTTWETKIQTTKCWEWGYFSEVFKNSKFSYDNISIFIDFGFFADVISKTSQQEIQLIYGKIQQGFL